MAETRSYQLSRCGYIAEAWTEDGVTVTIHCKMLVIRNSAHPD